MSRLFTLAAAIASFIIAAGAAMAAPSSYVSYSAETRKFVRGGDPVRGEAVHNRFDEANGAACAGCHGLEGVSYNPVWPSLAGQNAMYIYKQLQDFKYGRRINPTDQFAAYMALYANALTDQDMADVASYYASLPHFQSQATPEHFDGDLASAKRLAERGDGERLIPSCNSCHGTKGQGAPVAVPAIAGQNFLHFRETMQDYKDGVRANDIYSVMRHIVEQLTDEEIEALAYYYASLGQ